ncbi:hypothetical protein V499_00635 [Pseudogymnoascus sp. VKM F-103]|nr:hypothetical protein V499_00635 [Pseudogymnoascus sp. VKM F-103]
MADEVIDLLEPQVREMLRILNISDKDAEMRKLIFRLGETKTPPPTPPSMQKDTKSLRRSSRLAFHPPNQSYKSKQGRYRRSRRQRRGSKQGRCIRAKMLTLGSVQPVINDSANGEPANDEPAIDHTMIETTFCDPLELEPANGGPDGGPANGEPAIDHTMIETTFCDPLELELANGQRIDADTNKPAHDDGMAMLDEYYQNSPIDLGRVDGIPAFDTRTYQSPTNDDQDTTLNAPGCARLQNSNQLLETHETNMNPPCTTLKASDVKHVVQDESGHLVADVVKALEEASDTSCIPGSNILGFSEIFWAETTSMEFSKVMSSLVVNGAKCIRRIARTALDIEQERLRMHERDQLERIAEDRQQMNMTLAERTASEMSYQKMGKQLRRSTEDTISRLDVEELAERDFQEIISEPTELTGDFKEESDYETVLKQIEIEKARDTRTKQRRLWKETYYWPMIQQRAKMIGTLPTPSGRQGDVTPQEKVAAKSLLLVAVRGQSRDSYLKWTSYWKLLSDLRNAGATTLLLYRTSAFKTYFYRHTKKLDLLLSWNEVFDLLLQRLRLRIIAEEGNDFSGTCDIEDKRIFERLRVVRIEAWGNDISVWDRDHTEYENFLANHSMISTSGKSNKHVLRHGVKGKFASNKAIYIDMLPYEGVSGKRVIGKKPASTKLLSICPLISVCPGDFLGIFAGKLRYLDSKPLRAIKGPIPRLWLDYSEFPSKLNQMRVAKPGESTNVCLAWEAVNECLDRPDLRNVRLLHRAFDNAARRILFRTIFLKVNLHSFGKLSKISEHETLRHYVEVFIYDGRELEFAEGSGYEEWLHHTAAGGIGIPTDKRDKFLARFSQQQLHEYYFNFCRYVRLVQGPILQGDNEIKWLLKAIRRFPRLSVVEYAENEQGFKDDDRELQPMSFFSPLAQETLAEPEEGWGIWDKHFWALRHSTTLLSLELSDMALQRGNETIEGGAQALWIMMIQFLSQSMSLKRIKLIGRFTTDTNEAWSTCGAGEDGSVCPPRQDGCLLSRIEHFIIHGGLCPFTLRKPERLYDVHMDASHNEGPWIPENSWSWEEDDTWRFAAFMIEGTLGEESFLEELLSVDTLIPG